MDLLISICLEQSVLLGRNAVWAFGPPLLREKRWRLFAVRKPATRRGNGGQGRSAAPLRPGRATRFQGRSRQAGWEGKRGFLHAAQRDKPRFSGGRRSRQSGANARFSTQGRAVQEQPHSWREGSGCTFFDTPEKNPVCEVRFWQGGRPVCLFAVLCGSLELSRG